MSDLNELGRADLAGNHVTGAMRVAAEAHQLLQDDRFERAAVEAQLSTTYAISACANALIAIAERMPHQGEQR